MLRRIVVLFLTLYLALPALAIDSSIYTVTVPVANQSETQRTVAFAAALQVLLDRLNASSAQGQAIDLSTPMEHPEQYVESFSYINDPEQADALEINVRFDRESLKQYLPQQKVAQSQNIVLEVAGISSISALNALSDAIRHTDHVQSVTIQQVFSDKVSVAVVFQGNVANIIQALLMNPHLSSINPENQSENSSLLYFQWTE